jgi:hypothetical protein
MIDELTGARTAILDYLRRELLGPRDGEQEELREEPYRRYTVGTLYPLAVPTDPITREEEEDAAGAAGDPGTDGLQENQADDPVVLANQYLPSSMGLSFYLKGDRPDIAVRVDAARYVEARADEQKDSGGKREKRTKRWRRTPATVPGDGTWLELVPGPDGRTARRDILDGSARLHAVWRLGRDGWLVTVTVINNVVNRSEGLPAAEDCLYQVELRCRPAGRDHISAYPRERTLTNDQEEHLLDLLYRRQAAYGVGHGCSVAWSDPIDGAAAEIWTDLLPTYEVPAMSYELPGYERVLDLYFLAGGDSGSADEFIGELDRFVAGYRDWVDELPDRHRDIPSELLHARETLLDRMRVSLDRMNAGVRLLERDPTIRRAFCLANRAMLMQMAHSSEEYAGERHVAGEYRYREPVLPPGKPRRWRPFQLAFQLLTIASVAFPEDPYRGVVDLIWFPTGGGKTEAYLAVTAFLIFYRRMIHGSAGSGTAVLMRYTLRLLTTQQFQRAATLICACEQLRKAAPEELGGGEISIGLWVGQGTTPNRYQQAREEYDALLEQEEPRTFFQLDRCPWCGTELLPAGRQEDRGLYGVRSTNHEFWLFCPNGTCPFHERLPVGVVDQQLYDRPPTLLLATVDKFARLPWEERVAEFFGGEERRPPDLIIQDELHLISGPLGTIVGVYETAVDALASWEGSPPKILASTATIRRADEQCAGLYARQVEVFPPSGLDASDSYFARYNRTEPGRLYIGVLAPGHTASTSMIRTSAALLQAPRDLKLENDALDAYWTLVAYHNSLRELGKSRTFGADDIPARIKVIARDQDHLRELSDDNVQELTSNIGAAQLGGMLERMERQAWEDGELSLLLCTNMLSVGVDVQRLGMMLVKYIQATSRVGRGRVPGLVACVYSPSKPRDRSHYERFVAYHSALYRQVEPTSVTPFARPARDRALHAVLVSLVRYKTGLSEPADAGEFSLDLPNLDRIIRFIEERVSAVDPGEAASAIEQINRLLDEWEARAEDLPRLEYSSTHRAKEVLLRNRGDGHVAGWETLQSMRNVDSSCLIKIIGA